MIVRSSRRTLLAALVPLLAATAWSAHGSVPDGYQTQSRTPLAGGVHHEVLTRADPAQAVHVARVAPGAARLVAVSSHDTVAHQGAGGELPSDLCRRVGCLAGITGDFRDPRTGSAAGGVVSGGRLLRSPVPGRPQLIVTRDGRLQAGPLDWSGSVTSSDGRSVAVGGVNVDPRPGDVVLYTPAWGGDTPEGADTELVVRSSGAAIGAIGADTALEIVGLRYEPGPVPAGGAVLAASGSSSALLHELGDNAAGGRISRTLTLRIRSAVDAQESLGGNPVVLRGGQPAFADVDDGFTRGRHPRSLVGWNAAGEVVLVTVDGGRADASGMTLAEAAGLLAGLGATDAFGFDHRSATFVAGGEVMNLPVDDVEPGAPAPTGGREVAPGHVERPAVNALMVLPKPPAPPPPAAPPSTKPGPGSGTKPATGGTTATTAPVKVTGAGGGSPAPGVAAPAVTGGSVLPGSIGDVLRDPGTKRVKRPTARIGKGRKKADRGGEAPEGYLGDPSIPGWDDITAALTPGTLSPHDPEAELSLGPADPGRQGPGTPVVPIVLRLVAAAMIGTVLWGLHRAREGVRARPALWF